MTREETVKYLYDLLKKHSVKVNEVDVIPVSSCIALVDDFINHETDTLKEFVEWEKRKIRPLIEAAKNNEIFFTSQGDFPTAEFYTREYKLLQIFLSHLDQDLGNFLK